MSKSIRIPSDRIGGDISDYIARRSAKDPEFAAGINNARMYRAWGETARKAREKLGLSQAELAQRAGTTQPWLSKFENAETVRLDLSNVHRVLNALNLELVIQPRKRARNTSRTGARTRTA